MKQKTGIKLIIFLILIVVTLFVVNYFNLTSHLNTENIRLMVASAGILGPLIFIALYILTSIFFLPGSILSIASGAIFGVTKGTILTVIGASLGAILAFLISRYFTRSFFEEVVERKYKKLKEYDKKLEEKGFITVLILRFIPLLPFNGLNFGLGLTSVRLRDYALATVLGIIPGSLLFAYLGDSIAEMKYVSAILAVILIILLSLSLNIHKVYKKRRNKIYTNTKNKK